MQIEYNHQKKCLIVTIEGELDHHTAASVRETIDKELFSGPAKNLIFDFEHLTFMDSSGIGVIIGRYKTVSAQGGKVIIACASPSVERILHLSGILKLTKVARTRGLALEMI